MKTTKTTSSSSSNISVAMPSKQISYDGPDTSQAFILTISNQFTTILKTHAYKHANMQNSKVNQ